MDWLTFVLLVLVVMLGLFSRFFSSGSTSLKVGQPAPDFRLEDQHRRIHNLASFHGKWLALYFYPKDDTPGCTNQACAFRDVLQELADLGAIVIGVSVDDTTSHEDFDKKYHLQFPLLADTTGETARRYRSLINLGFIKFAKRNTFLINPQGNIARIYLSANAKRNSDELIRDLKQLQVVHS